MRYEFAVYVATGNDRGDHSAFLDKERGVCKATFRVVIQEFARLQKSPVHGFFHDKSIPAGFSFGAVRQNFVHIL